MLMILAVSAWADAWDNVMTNEYDAPIVWSMMPVPYEVNGANTLGLDPDAVVYATASAAGAWVRVEGTNAELQFTGTGDRVRQIIDGQRFRSAGGMAP